MDLNQALTQGQILKFAIEKRKQSDARFSLRGLALRMGLSAAFLSKVFNDKALLPLTHLEQIASLLEIDSEQKLNLKDAVIRARVRHKPELAAETTVAQAEVATSSVVA